MEEEDFDPTFLKKKKKKKTFDLDAALGLDDGSKKEETKEVTNDETAANEIDDNLDLESFGKKKKKKKKALNLDDLEGALPKVEGDEAPREEKTGESMDAEDSAEADAPYRDYTYDELLKRIFEIILDKNPEMAAGRKPKFVMRPPQVLRVGTKKTSFANFLDIARTLHRLPKHLLDFLLAELGTSGSLDGNQQLIIKGRFQPKQIENVLRRYIKEYVTCHTCRSPETILQKDTRIFFLQCESCGSRCSVASIKSGFQAVTGKRAAIRAKTT
ncbi:eukaryotic translation initiation factor 2 subunit 2 [Stomoxys calcitrans]|uniref:Eukaryotic translation initiation factor 2 subunit 2 n=1 Tax=Stomoxys calcitrans TaxID=35570 RepID=A0A1I8P1X5_STOCA|nr:eukaryotic translation initiation factor 2 subunit 2 [Stomoxys calcitrans]